MPEECAHKNLTWYSGEPYVRITLNGDGYDGVCDDCGTEFWMDDDEEGQ